jgi:hypothetical protein
MGKLNEKRLENGADEMGLDITTAGRHAFLN